MPTENAHCWPEDRQVRIMRHFTMGPLFVTWTSTTVIWQKAKPAIPATIWRPILAAAEYAGASGRDLMAALAVAYQVQCRLSDVAAVRAAGFDHTVQGAYAVAAGVARVLGLDVSSAANAIAISGTALNGLRVTRTGKLSQWKGLAYPHMAVLLHCHRLPGSSGNHRSVGSD